MIYLRDVELGLLIFNLVDYKIIIFSLPQDGRLWFLGLQYQFQVVFFCTFLNALPLCGDLKPGSEQYLNGPPWALCGTQGRKALPTLINLKSCVFFSFFNF